MNTVKQPENMSKIKEDDIEYQLLQMKETLSTMQNKMDEDRRLIQSSRLSMGIIVIGTVILLGLAVLFFSSSLHTMSSVLFHGVCLAGIGVVIALLCTVLPKSKKNL